MGDTTVTETNILDKWSSKFFKEYIRTSGLLGFMGPSFNNVFVTNLDLMSKGREINMPWVGALSGTGTGTAELVGNEDVLDNDGYRVRPVWRRNAVAIKKSEEKKSSISLLNARRDALMIWAQEDLRDKMIHGLDTIAERSSAFNQATGHEKQVDFSEATTAEKNTYAANNEFRLLFGDAEANYSATMATALANVTTAMTLDTDAISLMKRMAKRPKSATNTVPSIRPIKINANIGREFFVLFLDSINFRNIKKDATVTQANREARERNVSTNPIFQDGDLIYDGVIIKEIPEIDETGNLGATSNPLSPAYFCGAQSVGIAWGQKTKTTKRNEDDYGFVSGAGIEELRGVEKLFFNEHGNTDLQHGMITGFFDATV